MADEPNKDLEPRDDAPAFEGGDISLDKTEGDVTAKFKKEVDVSSESEEPEKEPEKEEPEKEEEKPEEPFRTFKTQEELDAYIRLQTPEKKEEPEDKEPPKRDPLKLYEGYYDEKTGKWVGEAPKDWNDFATRLRDALTPEVAQEVKGLSESERKELDKINAEFDREYNALATAGKVPALNTKEGQEVNKQISLIGATYGIGSITKAHELWAKIPKDQGGGLEVQPKEDPEKTKAQAQKKRAGQVGSSKGTPSKQTNKKTPYNKLHFTNTDDLIEEALNE